MGRLIGAGRPGRLLVLLTGTFALAHPAGLIFYSSSSDNSTLSFSSLLFLFFGITAWTFLCLIFIDTDAPSKSFMTNILKRKRSAEILASVILFILFPIVAATMIRWNDEQSNLLAAKYLIDHGFAKYFADYSKINEWLGPHHPPLLPVLYASLYAATSLNLIAGRVFAVVCSLFACLLGYFWARRLLGRRLAVTTIFMLPSIPLVLFCGSASILDSPFWLITAAVLLSFEKFLESKKAGSALLCGFLLSLAIMSRYNGLLLAAVLFFILLIQNKNLSLISRWETWIVFLFPLSILGSWFAYAASTGTFMVQFHKMLSLVLVAVVPPGGGFYLKTILVPLIPFMIGMWNVPLWIAGGIRLYREDGDLGSRRLVIFCAMTFILLLASLPNPRYLLSLAPALSALTARQLLEVEDREGRGLEFGVYLLGISLLHVAVIVSETFHGNVYFFY